MKLNEMYTKNLNLAISHLAEADSLASRDQFSDTGRVWVALDNAMDGTSELLGEDKVYAVPSMNRWGHLHRALHFMTEASGQLGLFAQISKEFDPAYEQLSAGLALLKTLV